MQELVKLDDKYYIIDIRRLYGDGDGDCRQEQSTAGPTDLTLKIQCNLFDLALAQLWRGTVTVNMPFPSEHADEESDCVVLRLDTVELINETILAQKAADYSFKETEVGAPWLRLTYYICTTALTVHLNLQAASQEQLTQHIVLPVWRSMLVLYEENWRLTNMLLEKDIEIEQYKLEGAALKRTTSKFEKAKFDRTFPFLQPEEDLKVIKLIKPEDHRWLLMKLLKIKRKVTPTESTSRGKPTALTTASTAKDLSSLEVAKIREITELSQHELLSVWRSLLLLYEKNCSLRYRLLEKDIEIEQYKLERAVLKQNLVVTPKFDEATFDSTFLFVLPEEGLRVRDLIKFSERRCNLMKVLKIKCTLPPMKSTRRGKPIVPTALTPTRKSPDGRAKGLNPFFTKQRIPKSSSTSSPSLKRLRSSMDDGDNKEGILEKHSKLDTSTVKDLSSLGGTSK